MVDGEWVSTRSVELGQAQVEGTLTSESDQFNLNTNVTTNQNGDTMKTLADFEQPISASTATINTNRGAITFELYATQAPLTVTNFLTLAQEGYYDNLKFHRVIEGFMAQTGDPLSRENSPMVGTGGPGYTIEDEFDPSLKHDAAGVVSMANVGAPNTGGSQFFITFEPTPWLDGKHAIFGRVTDSNSLQVLESIKQDDAIFNIDFN